MPNASVDRPIAQGRALRWMPNASDDRAIAQGWALVSMQGVGSIATARLLRMSLSAQIDQGLG